MDITKKSICQMWIKQGWLWFKFGLIFFLTTTAILAIIWGYLFWEWEKEQQILKKVGESYMSDITVFPLGEELGKWLKSKLGRFAFVLDRVGSITFNNTTTDAQMAYIYEFENLNCLCLENTLITDAGLMLVVKNTNLTVINLDGTHVTDAGLKYLQECKSLHWLFLGNTKITDAGLLHLQKNETLDVLGLSMTLVSDAGLENIGKLDKLRMLYLNDTQITDAGLMYLQECKNLHWLHLNNTKISDIGLEYIQKLKGFDRLRLEVINTKTTNSAIKKLRDKYPKLVIINTNQ